MSYYDFAYLFLQNNLFVHIIMYCCFGLFFVFYYRKCIVSIFDPYLFSLVIPHACIATIILWLAINNYVSTYSIVNLVILFICFTLGLNCTKIELSIGRKKNRAESVSFFRLFYLLHTLLFCFCFVLIVRKINIINAFKDKLSSRASLGGTLIALWDLLSMGQLILIFLKRKKYKLRNIFDKILLIMCFYLGLCSGSKSAIISFISSVIFISICINYFVSGSLKKIKLFTLRNILVLITFILSFILFLFISDTNPGNKIEKLFGTLFEFGDIYYYVLPNELYKYLQPQPIFPHIFYAFFSPLRHFISLPKNSVLGYDITSRIYGIPNPPFGPNSRSFIILLMSQNYFAKIGFSFLLGFIIRYVRKMNFFLHSFYGIYYSIYIILIAPKLLIDLNLFGISFMPLITVIPFMYILTYIIYHGAKNIRDKND